VSGVRCRVSGVGCRSEIARFVRVCSSKHVQAIGQHDHGVELPKNDRLARPTYSVHAFLSHGVAEFNAYFWPGGRRSAEGAKIIADNSQAESLTYGKFAVPRQGG
jgi:hypothetical protein